MSFLKKLFGGGEGASQPEPETYKGYLIFPEPVTEGAQFRLGARIEREIDGEVKVHSLIRADTFQSKDTAIEAAIVKAKQVIDQQGDDIF